jgi:hypothetical protein
LYSNNNAKDLNKNAAGEPAAFEKINKSVYLLATGAIRGSPALSNPRMPMHKKKLPDCSYLIVTGL